jgi:hypothetical protein
MRQRAAIGAITYGLVGILIKIPQKSRKFGAITCGLVGILIKIATKGRKFGAITYRPCRNFDKYLCIYKNI